MVRIGESTKKWLVLLVVLVALVLVAELLSLNVLYGLVRSSGLGGELAQYGYSATGSATSSSSGSWRNSPSYLSCMSGCSSTWNSCYDECDAYFPDISCYDDCDYSSDSCAYTCKRNAQGK